MRSSYIIGFFGFSLMLVTWCVGIYTGSDNLMRIAVFTGVLTWGVWRLWP